MFKNIVRKLLIVAGTLVLIWCGAAMTMVLWPVPRFVHPFTTSTPDATQAATPVRSADIGGTVQFHMRDEAVLRGREFGPIAPVTILFLHGVMSSSDEYLETCSQLHSLTGARVIALDLRGHGRSDGTPGDIHYIGQYEDDVADVLTLVHREQPVGRIILAGHSMGGGIVMRYVSLHSKPAADGYLLFAPHFGVKSPTMRLGPAPGAASIGEPLMKLALPRVLGLIMLNSVGVRSFNGLDTLFFNVPPAFPIHAYSFRAMVSMTPDNYVAALTADSKPLLVIVGSNDEAFYADRFSSVVSIHQNGKTELISGPTHDGIVHSAAALSAAADWLRQTVRSIDSKS
jgi:alpha-beta hydrolase superfamily lysophospholipase